MGDLVPPLIFLKLVTYESGLRFHEQAKQSASSMSGPLAIEMKPVVDASLADAGVVKSYDAVMDRYNAVPFVRRVDADLSDYVVQKGMDGIFYYLAMEEAAIRERPAKRTTELLKRVFGQ